MQMNDFYATRISPEFDKGYYKTLKSDKTFSMNKMAIRDSILFFRTSSKGASMEGVDCDYIGLDEYDRLDPLSEQSAIESLASSNYKCLRRWSTPTAPGVLIDKLYNESTMNRWYIKCSHCGFEQVLDYEQNIKLVNKDGIDTISRVVKPGTYQYVCRKCGKPIDADRWYNGHWVEEKPGKGKRVGFSISQMDAVWLTADNLKQKELQAPSKNYFYNYVVG